MKAKSCDIKTLFPTLLGRVEFDEYESINSRIVDYVRECEREGKISDSRSDGTTNWGNGFQIQLFREKVPVIEEFMPFISQALEGFLDSVGLSAIKKMQAELTTAGWIVVARDGSYNAPHVHPHGTFSSIYHVQVPDRPSPEGYLEFINPTGSAALQSFGHASELVQPKEGTLLIIPSYLMHGVHPFQGEGERISLNIDYAVTLKKTDGSNLMPGIQRS